MTTEGLVGFKNVAFQALQCTRGVFLCASLSQILPWMLQVNSQDYMSPIQVLPMGLEHQGVPGEGRNEIKVKRLNGMELFSKLC